MASIYKRTQDSGKKRPNWYIGWIDHHGKHRTTKGFTDKQQTERYAATLEHEAMLRKRGLIDPESERIAGQQNAPIEEHLQAFKESLSGNSPKHIKLIMARVRRVTTGCDIQSLADISAEEVRACIERVVTEKNLGNRTYNHYVQAFDGFCKWLIVNKRMVANPVIGLERRNTEIDIRHKRRALTAEEFAKLVKSARTGGISIQCFDGETRARIYTLSYMTGLRRNEIASLTPRSFQLAAELPTVTVEAAFSKHRRRDVLPLHPELVIMLRTWLRGIPPDEPLFPKLAQRRTWYMVKVDLEGAGIEYETPEGIADFHAAGRHTHITELLRNGATLPQAKELARHSDVKMTMRYTHIGIEDQAKALRQLPWNRETVGDATTAHESSNQSDGAWEQTGSKSGGRDGRTSTSSVTSESKDDESDIQAKHSADTTCHKERTRDARRKKTPNSFDSRRLHLLNQETGNDLEKSEESLGVSWEHSKDGECRLSTLAVSSFGPTLDYIAEHWPSLPPHIREAVLTLIHSASISQSCEGGEQ